MTGSCACGAVRITLTKTPDYINDCNCSLCRKVGAAWGYFTAAQVSTTGATQSFERSDKEQANVSVHACERCSSTTHCVISEAFANQNPGVDWLGVNMRLFEESDLTGVELRFPNGRDWSGAGEFVPTRSGTYRQPRRVVSR